MFWFQHPKPSSRKAVAEQVVARKQEALPSTRVIIVEPASAGPAGGGDKVAHGGGGLGRPGLEQQVGSAQHDQPERGQ
jgi:hypothetical protein